MTIGELLRKIEEKTGVDEITVNVHSIPNFLRSEVESLAREDNWRVIHDDASGWTTLYPFDVADNYAHITIFHERKE
jgi:hypothetical protein